MKKIKNILSKFFLMAYFLRVIKNEQQIYFFYIFRTISIAVSKFVESSYTKIKTYLSYTYNQDLIKCSSLVLVKF